MSNGGEKHGERLERPADSHGRRQDTLAHSPEQRPELPPTVPEAPCQGGFPLPIDDDAAPYRLLGKIGEGGMGTVYLAEQTEPIQRRVALKLIKPGLDTNQVLARFESERQALARMSHPNVARVLDAGATGRGRPYFVMELVDGQRITGHCDATRAGLRERIELFVQVCAGVQHAHQKGILHRDIKPANVLVALEDGRPVPKIIDFGLAKAMHQPLTDRTLLTRAGQALGTPEYTSPEQAAEDGDDVDTRTDVYSLGVLLYELLVGTLPFTREPRQPASLEELRRRIREDEPSRPSTRVSQIGASSAEAARRRRTDADTLRNELAGDLDWIVMKALAKERARRYESPSALAADLRRYLAGEPVLARPPSASYRLRKFVGRHRAGVTVAAVLAVAVAVGAGGALWGLVSAWSANEQARREAEAKAEVAGLLQEIFVQSDPRQARGDELTARELLDRASARIDTIEADLATKASLMRTLGEVYQSIGLHPRAEELLRGAVEAARTSLGDEHELTVAATMQLADVLHLQAGYDEAERLLRRVVRLRQEQLGPEHRKSLFAAANLGLLLRNTGRLQEAESLLEDTLSTAREALGDDDPVTLRAMHYLANVHRNAGRFSHASELYADALEGRRSRLGGDHPDTLFTMTNLASALTAQDRTEEAERLLRRALALRREVLGDEHPFTLATLEQLGTTLHKAGALHQAERVLREVVAARKRRNDPLLPQSQKNLARVYIAQGRVSEARPLAAGYLAYLEQRCSRRPDDVGARADYALALLTLEPADLQDPAKALRLALEVNEATEYELPQYRKVLARAYRATGQPAKAGALTRR